MGFHGTKNVGKRVRALARGSDLRFHLNPSRFNCRPEAVTESCSCPLGRLPCNRLLGNRRNVGPGSRPKSGQDRAKVRHWFEPHGEEPDTSVRSPGMTDLGAVPPRQAWPSPMRRGVVANMPMTFCRASRAFCRSPLMVCSQTIAGQRTATRAVTVSSSPTRSALPFSLPVVGPMPAANCLKSPATAPRPSPKTG